MKGKKNEKKKTKSKRKQNKEKRSNQNDKILAREIVLLELPY